MTKTHPALPGVSFFEDVIEEAKMTNADEIRIRDIAGAVYDGGWRSDDRDEIIEEYELSGEDADRIVQYLIMFEERDQKRLYEKIIINFKESFVRIMLNDAAGETVYNDVREFEQDPDVEGYDEDSAFCVAEACIEEFSNKKDDDIMIVKIDVEKVY